MKSRAAILHSVGTPWSVEEFELDPPRAGEVLVQMAAAGLCHSDEHIRQGSMSAPKDASGSPASMAASPRIGGHEGSGVVLEVGEGVSVVAPGDHVVMSVVPVCGQCRWCATGMEYLCDAGAGALLPGMPTDGTFRHHTSEGQDLGHVSKIGAFAEHTVVSVNSIVKIDSDFPLPAAALLSCAVPTGYGSAAYRANVRGGATVVVIGAGGIGTAAIQGARINGAATIVAIDPVEFKRRSAFQFGATHAAATAEEAVDLLRDLTRGVMADSVVLAPALIAEDDVDGALALTRKGGTCVLAGLSAQALHSVTLDLQNFILMNKNLCGTILGSCNPKADIPLLAALYRSGRLQLDEMITKRYRLDQINDAYADLSKGDLIRGVIDFGIS